jgi:Mn2+/Fe2+ NRAMP family transporter
MQGFGRRPITPLHRRLLGVIPALILGAGVEPTDALVWSQIVLSFALPGTLAPLLLLTCDRQVMVTAPGGWGTDGSCPRRAIRHALWPLRHGATDASGVEDLSGEPP